MDYFDFIGITEFYEDDLACFADRYLHAPLENHKVNTAPENERKNELSNESRKKVEQFHQKDMDLYHRAMELRAERGITR